MKLPTIQPILASLAILCACTNAREAAGTAAPSEATPPPPPPATYQYGGAGRIDSLFFTLERTPCFGPCKAYRIDVYRTGFATYDGRLNMEKEGRHTTRVDQETLALLLAKAEEAGFFGMKDRYDADVTDLPSTFIHIVANGKDKKVIGRVGQPEAFKSLAAFAEEQLLPLPWKLVAAEP